MWRIPAKRMKMRREHVVPLARQVVAMLHELHRYYVTESIVYSYFRFSSSPSGACHFSYQ